MLAAAEMKTLLPDDVISRFSIPIKSRCLFENGRDELNSLRRIFKLQLSHLHALKIVVSHHISLMTQTAHHVSPAVLQPTNDAAEQSNSTLLDVHREQSLVTAAVSSRTKRGLLTATSFIRLPIVKFSVLRSCFQKYFANASGEVSPDALCTSFVHDVSLTLLKALTFPACLTYQVHLHALCRDAHFSLPPALSPFSIARDWTQLDGHLFEVSGEEEERGVARIKHAVAQRRDPAFLIALADTVDDVRQVLSYFFFKTKKHHSLHFLFFVSIFYLTGLVSPHADAVV
jgi:hypothetical protein